MCYQRFSNGLTEYQKSSQMSYKTIKTLTTWQPFLFKGNFIYNLYDGDKVWQIYIILKCCSIEISLFLSSF